MDYFIANNLKYLLIINNIKFGISAAVRAFAAVVKIDMMIHKLPKKKENNWFDLFFKLVVKFEGW